MDMENVIVVRDLELISEYGEEKWKRPTDIIHLANKGYYAIAKNIHAGIKAIESGVITN